MPIPHLRPQHGHRPRPTGPIERASRSGKRRNWRRLLLRAGIVAVAFFVVSGVATFAFFSRDLPDPNSLLERTVAQSTRIFARDGETVLYEIHGDERRTLTKLEDIPEILKQATIAIEDKNFYKHGGFSIVGFVRAAWVNVTSAGQRRPGGSTITQQLVKNTILSNEKTLTRKVKELVLSYEIERKFTKDQILQLYLNEIGYGSNNYGVAAASRSYFAKDVKDLTIAEAALLAALPQRPTYYSPYGTHMEELSARHHTVIQAMHDQGYISAEDAEAAKKERLVFQKRREAILAPHFVFYVKELLAENYTESEIEHGGLKVVTTLDYDKQKIAEEEVAKGVANNERRYRATNAALVSIDAKTGQILAMVGSKDYFDTENDGNVNVAVAVRNPGSSFKPFVYTAAFSRGFTPETILYDIKTDFGPDGSGRTYSPSNYDGRERGPLSMRQALAGSLNIPAVQTLYLAGIPRVVSLGNALGYSTFKKPEDYGLALALGGAGVKLVEHTNAFATLAREGQRLPSSAILRIEDNRGRVLEEWKEPRAEQIIDKNVARLTNSILTDNAARAYVFGSRSPLVLPGRTVAAKTGTTNDWRDGWTMGFTPSLVTGVWAGNNDNSVMARGADGVLVAAPIWNAYMRRALDGQKAESFTRPRPNNAKKSVLKGEIQGEQTVDVDTVTGKRIPAECLDTWPAAYKTTATVREVHSILHYVSVEDPLGDAPKDPASDPMYTRWEKSVVAWAAKKYSSPGLALESCDLRTGDKLPTISISSPGANQTVTDPFAPTVVVAAPRGIARVDYAIDGVAVASSATSPYSASLSLTGLAAGLHTLSATVVDAVQNSVTATVNFNVSTETAPSVYFTAPNQGATFAAASTIDFTIAFSSAAGVSEIALLERVGGTLVAVRSVASPGSSPVTFSVPGITPGEHSYIARLTTPSGTQVTTDVLFITVSP